MGIVIAISIFFGLCLVALILVLIHDRIKWRDYYKNNQHKQPKEHKDG